MTFTWADRLLSGRTMLVLDVRIAATFQAPPFAAYQTL